MGLSVGRKRAKKVRKGQKWVKLGLAIVQTACCLRELHLPRFALSVEDGELLLKHDLFSVVQRKTQLVKTMINEKSCGAVVYAKNPEINFLLLQYEAGHWDFVKGNVEEGEAEKETVVRELGEETGISDAKFIEGFKEKIAYFYKRQGSTVSKEVVFFLIETHTTKVQLSFEHIGYEWLPYERAMEKLNFKNAKDVLQKAHAFMKKQGIIESPS